MKISKFNKCITKRKGPTSNRSPVVTGSQNTSGTSSLSLTIFSIYLDQKGALIFVHVHATFPVAAKIRLHIPPSINCR